MKSIKLLVLFSLLFSVYSCNNKFDNDISAVLDKRKQSFEKKDIDTYKDLISAEYEVTTRSGIKKRADIIKEFKLNTTPFDKIEMSHSDRSVYNNGDTAKAVQKTLVLLEIDDKKTNYEITEVILLVKENGHWKISKESNLDLFRGFVFGEKG